MPKRGPIGPIIRRGRGGTSTEVVAPPATVTMTDDYPELLLEWMPDGKPNDADGTWESLTPYLASGTCRRGRKYELDRFVAGTMSFTLKVDPNRDGVPGRIFDPEYAAGIYYGKLLQMKQIRLRAKWAGVWYPVWRGYVTSWGQVVEDDVVFASTVTCRDAFERLERTRLPSSAWALIVQRQNPSAWFRLGESDTNRVTDSSPNGNYGVYDNVTQGVAGLVPNDADGACEWPVDDEAEDMRVTIQNPTLISGYPFSISAMVQVRGDYAYASSIVTAAYVAGSTTQVVQLVVSNATVSSAAGRIVFGVYNGVPYRQVESSLIISDNRPHHVVAVARSASDFAIYIDGVDATGSVLAGSGSPSYPTSFPSGYCIGNLPNDYDSASQNYAMRGVIDEVVFWNAALAADTIAAMSAAALRGWAGDDSGARADRFLDAIGWPDELRDISTGVSVLQAAAWSAGSSALAALQTWADTEAGAFFAGKDGKLVWRNRHYPLLDMRATRSQATFGDANSSATLKYRRGGFSLTRDENLIRNPIIASRRNGVAVQQRDDALADGVYGDRTWSAPESEDAYDSTVSDRAVWFLNRWKNEKTRLASMSVQPQRTPEVGWPTVLGLELGDRITIEYTPGRDVSSAGATHVRLDGSSGCYISTPDDADYTGSGTIRWMAKLTLADWTPSANMTVASHQLDSTNRGWLIRVSTSGQLVFGLSADGSATTVSQGSSALGITDGDTYWVGVQYVCSTGALDFYKAAESLTPGTDFTGWTSVSSHSVAAATPFNAATALELGSYNFGGSQRLTGSIHQFKMVSGGSVVADFDPRMQTASPFSSGGATWTLNGTAALATTPIQVDQILESIEHRFSPTAWVTTFQGSPVDPNVGSYLILDDEVAGLLDAGLLAY